MEDSGLRPVVGGLGYGKSAHMAKLVADLRAAGHVVHEVDPRTLREPLRGSPSALHWMMALDEPEALRLLRSEDPEVRKLAEAVWDFRAASNDDEQAQAAERLRAVLARDARPKEE